MTKTELSDFLHIYEFIFILPFLLYLHVMYDLYLKVPCIDKIKYIFSVQKHIKIINKEKCSAKEKRRKRINTISNVIKLRFSFKRKKERVKWEKPLLRAGTDQ